MKAGLKFNIQKTKIMASGSITLWQIEGEKVEAVANLFSWAPESPWVMTAASQLEDLLLGRKTVINLDSILKSKDISFLTKVHRIKAMVFPVVRYGCESWTIKKAEH